MDDKTGLQVLTQDPKNAKALVRRGTSFEHNEKHKKVDSACDSRSRY